MPLYEHVFLARQDLATSQVDSLAESLTKIVEEQGGKVEKTEYWGLRTLAYRMKKNRKAHYVMLNVSAPAAAVAELERNVRLNEDVLRYMTVRVGALETEQSAMMRRDREGRRGERRGRDGDRGGRDGDRGDRGDRGGRDGRDGGREGREPRGERDAERARG